MQAIDNCHQVEIGIEHWQGLIVRAFTETIDSNTLRMIDISPDRRARRSR